MAGIDGLVPALRKLVLTLENDLRARVDGPDDLDRQPEVHDRWYAEYEAALKARRTAAAWEAWRDERVTQAAVAWVLLTVFARYCEDHRLVSVNWISGPNPDAHAQALDARRAYFHAHPEHTDREWLEQISTHFAKFDATKSLVDDYSPMHVVAPSGDVALEVLEFWWDRDESGEPRWSFSDIGTRFLGDVYQYLSESARKTYALLQTPEFVEEFILDQTMEPALAERPLEGFTVIDPTCGSGHFLLGAFQRLLRRWEREAPGLGRRALVGRSLKGVYGVDINPFAVAIARFRLLVAALEASGDQSIEKAIGFELNLGSGDSLLWGAQQQVFESMITLGQDQFSYTTENAPLLRAIFERKYDVVVGNPPYITAKDTVLNARYRELYSTCHRKYALTVPFMELFHALARSDKGGAHPGWVGQITSNSFMKREFGSKLIEEFLPTRDLRLIIDSEGAWIPGHNSDGTPTVILISTGGAASSNSVRAALSKGIRETSDVGSTGDGPVWQSLVNNVSNPGFEDNFINIVNLPRSTIAKHPLSLSGGGAADLVMLIEGNASERLGSKVARIGFFGIIGADDAFIVPKMMQGNSQAEGFRPLSRGEEIRDYAISSRVSVFFPYTEGHKPVALDKFPATAKHMWPMRTELGNRTTFGGGTYFSEGRPWHEWHQLPEDVNTSNLAIAYAEVTSVNHFSINWEGYALKQTAPIVKLRKSANVDQHLGLLGILNTSVFCFWLKEKCKPKGGASQHLWTRTYQINAKTLEDAPLPSAYPLERARKLDSLAREIAMHSPAAVAARSAPTYEALEHACRETERLRRLMVAHQEELDWECYKAYGLVDSSLTTGIDVPEIQLGERPFEIALARRMNDGEDILWFSEHRSTPVCNIPPHLPSEYKSLLQRRLDAIASNTHLQLLEKPGCKRRWTIEKRGGGIVTWEDQVADALRDWILDRIEDRALWFDREERPTPRSVAQLAEILDRDQGFTRVLRMWASNQAVSTSAALKTFLADEGVPFLAAYRYKPAGLEKRAAWERTWDLQRREDEGEKLDAPIPVPPKYKPTDFAKQSYWSRRGKLDVPKERFISYPNAGRATDPTELLGWAGWDHGEQAIALAGLIEDRLQEGTPESALVPLLAGLIELQPWVRQWHAEVDAAFSDSVADTIDEEIRSRCVQFGVTAEEASAWRPPEQARRGGGRRKRSEETA
ncbi:BREX-2 system adenine-specific DNA-methyltransferase PglX [Nocardia wallacei]|uniref:BREX-2 system adenine-specific DNA-methyltransferase PglX n=1 Tax=Nocardia wallacei TaxID=480035 RepID=UPI0024574E70|nr:BREX-2 system adenine-specific DNA-methyltransferase PglX [Nocardia wallacei]